MKNMRVLKLTATTLMATFALNAAAQGSLTNAISGGVNGFSSYLNGTSGASTPGYFGSVNNLSLTSIVAQGSSNGSVDVSGVLQDSAADCLEIQKRIQDRNNDVAKVLTPQDNPGTATSDVGVDDILNIPIGINPAAIALAEIGKTLLTKIVVNKVNNYFGKQMQSMQNTIQGVNSKLSQLTTGFGF